MKIIVNDAFQKNYVYELVMPAGNGFDNEFEPDLSPRDMLELGVFGGAYFSDGHEEFPADWFIHARLSPSGPDPNLNCFKVSASQPLAVWQAKGWIYPDDPRGWFQWYCRYYMGRRIPEEDARQIKRWKAIRRHIGAIAKHCRPRDMTCRPKQRQALLHWAYDSRQM